MPSRAGLRPGPLFWRRLMPNILGSATGTTCPICRMNGASVEITARCKCPRSDSFCSNGHKWHTCTVHKVYVEGHSDHSTDTFTCTCGGDGGKFADPETYELEFYGDGDGDNVDCDGPVVDYEERARRMLFDDFGSPAFTPLAVVRLAILLEKADRADAKEPRQLLEDFLAFVAEDRVKYKLMPASDEELIQKFLA